LLVIQDNMPFICNQVQKQVDIVIKKGRGNRPVEALATLYL